jgi:hypothetical protein
LGEGCFFAQLLRGFVKTDQGGVWVFALAVKV